MELVWDMAQPLAEQLGLTLWDVRFVKEGACWYLRLFIDKEGGVGIEDCEAMSRAVNHPLDELDPIDQSYCLEVCSPGIERDLTRDEHFAAYLGSAVRVRLIRPLPDGRREVTGVLKACQNGSITLLGQQEEELVIEKTAAASVRVADDDVGGEIR